MVQYSRARLDGSLPLFGRHPTWRTRAARAFGRFDHGPRSELPHDPDGHEEHVGVLEQAGLVTTMKVGRVRTCKLGLRRPEEETAWIERYRQLWDSRFDELDNVVEELHSKEKVDDHENRD